MSLNRPLIVKKTFCFNQKYNQTETLFTGKLSLLTISRQPVSANEWGPF